MTMAVVAVVAPPVVMASVAVMEAGSALSLSLSPSLSSSSVTLL